MKKEIILGAIGESAGPITRAQLEEKLGESYRNFQSSIDYYKDKKRGWIEEVAEHTYILTDKGREELLDLNKIPGVASQPGLKDDSSETSGVKVEEGGEVKVGVALAPKPEEAKKPAEEFSEESLGTTEYQLFIKLGRQTGVYPAALIVQVADHIWAGGDYKDLTWVEMEIR